MRRLTMLIAALLMTACSHPLEIVGEGDILSASGERNCLLEDFQSTSPSCTENYVIASYSETYLATPSPGWIFEGWQNYCVDSNSNSCSFALDASTVTSYWGAVAPPLVAVFTQDNGIPMSEQVIANGRTWAQPDLFREINGEEIFAQCPQGICGANATIRSYSMNGWQLASVEDANAIFNYFIDDDVMGPGPDNYSSSFGVNDQWGPRIFAAGLRPTAGNSEILGFLLGISQPVESSMSIGSITTSIVGEPAYSNTHSGSSISGGSERIGAWFYRQSKVTDLSVVLNGREWAQPRIFTHVSWEDVASVCSEYAPCNGQLNGVDVTGWHWASISDALALLNSFGVSPPVMYEGDDVQRDNMGWYQNLEHAGLQTVFVTGDEKEIGGWTSKQHEDFDELAYSAFMKFEITEDEDETPPEQNTETAGSTALPVESRSAMRGVWLYRDL